DGFTELLRRYLNSAIAGEEGGERPHISLHINVKDLADHTNHADHAGASAEDQRGACATDASLFAVDGVAWTEWMGPLSLRAARLLSCDS
ncbi:HNH endonuclease, partial [Rhodococcus oxybenzonivorans]|nr:HNH endonuclease [Rhodococcus oxybenzonivorans]MDV7278446.1 HNH endonuclease [Rhodococcus oxybenzonivorans]